jgi:hypothetical protein
MSNGLFDCDCCDVRLKKYYWNSQFDIYFFSQFLELFCCEYCYLADLLIRYLWFPWSQHGFQCYDNSLKLVVALNFKQWIPGQLAAID